jgi:hypothetical protein
MNLTAASSVVGRSTVREGPRLGFNEGALRISTSQIGEIWWTNPSRRFDDVIVTVVARQTSGPDNNAYGVICRYQNEKISISF